MSGLHDSDLPEWKQLVYVEVEQLGSIQKVADKIGYSRVSLSLALRDKYIGSTKTLEEKVLRVLGDVSCPYLQKTISPTDCSENKNREAPTQNPTDMRFWRKCQNCPIGAAIKPREKKWQI